MKEFQKYEETFCILQDSFSLDREKYFEGLFTQGIGRVHIRGSYEEGICGADQTESYMRMPANVTVEVQRNPISKWGTYMAGITGVHPLLREETVNLPYVAAFFVRAEDVPLDMKKGGMRNYKRWLDVRDGVLYRTFQWEVKEGVILQVFYRRYLSAKRKGLFIQEMEFTAVKGCCHMEFQQDIVDDVKTNGYDHCKTKVKKAEGNKIYVHYETDRGSSVEMMSKVFCSGGKFRTEEGKCKGKETIKEGETVTIRKFSYIAVDEQITENNRESWLERKLEEAVCTENLYEEHQEIWRNKWENAYLEIEGNKKDQKKVNILLYHLLRCKDEENTGAAVCAKGFSGEAYFGHFFWDTEMYLLPFYIHTNTETAKRLMEFRIQTLSGAKKNAEMYGYPGAKYPWESSGSGEEQCPNWQYADHEVHVTADVVFGLWHIWKETGDEEFLKKAVPVFVETARYWMKRVEKKDDGSVNINGVMGPDEYICMCNNNAYTNEMVSRALSYTANVVEWSRSYAPEILDGLMLDEKEVEEFQRCADKLSVLKKYKTWIPQCDNFELLEEPDFEHSWSDKTKPFGACVSQEKNYRTKALKQADVLMLPFLFPKDMTKEQIVCNYLYYKPYTTHDSSLSYAVHSIICSQLGRKEEAYDFFQKALDIDTAEEKNGAAEGIHIANCGGVWQAIIYGFAGMSRCYEEEEIHFSPQLPSAWKSLSFPIFYGGKRFRVKIENDQVELKNIDENN